MKITILITYFFSLTIIVGCGDSVDILKTYGSTGTSGIKKIFVTTSLTNGNLGGVTGADSFCNNDSNKPDSSTYKALIVSNTRRACTTAECSGGPSEHQDWVMSANTNYYREDGLTLIGTTTDNGIFSFPLINSIDFIPVLYLSGLTANWQNSGST